MILIEDEIIQTWLCDLINEEIDIELKTISNERICQKGSNNDSDIVVREDNIAFHKKYIEILKDIKKKYTGKEK